RDLEIDRGNAAVHHQRMMGFYDGDAIRAGSDVSLYLRPDARNLAAFDARGRDAQNLLIALRGDFPGRVFVHAVDVDFLRLALDDVEEVVQERARPSVPGLRVGRDPQDAGLRLGRAHGCNLSAAQARQNTFHEPVNSWSATRQYRI